MSPHFKSCLRAFATGCLLLSFGCKGGEDISSDKGFIANNDSGNNYLLAFLGDSNGIPGTLQDIPAMSKVFNAANGFNFIMPGPYSGGWQHPDNGTITSEVSKAAKAMLDKDLEAWKKLQRGGTLFIYFTSHGSPDGTTSTGGGSSSIQFSDIARAIRTARGEHPVERLVVFFDTCFSGANVVGSKSITQNTGTGLGLVDPLIPEIAQPKSSDAALESFISNSINDANSVKGFYKSAIFMAASRPDETSGDGGTGGEGTQAFIRAVNAAKGGLVTQPTRNDNGTANGGGSISDIINSLGGNGQTTDENGFELVQTVDTTAGAGAGTGSSTATIKSVLQNMVSNAQGQTPVFCVEPKELADDFFFDPPVGYLPTNPVNAAKTGADNRECSR